MTSVASEVIEKFAREHNMPHLLKLIPEANASAFRKQLASGTADLVAIAKRAVETGESLGPTRQ
jgi:hypothetical protein